MIDGKLEKCIGIIEDFFPKISSNPYMSCSWGKDSIVLLWILKKKIGVDIPVVFLNSGYALPDIYEFRDYIIREWDIDYIEVQNEVDYLQIVNTFGLPDVNRDMGKQDEIVMSIKKNELNKLTKKMNFDGHFWGIRAAESKRRKKFLMKYSPIFTSKKENISRCAPLAWVTDIELWSMIDRYDIPYCSVYDKTMFQKREKIRNSGWLTTDGANYNGRISFLKYYYPDYYEKLVEINSEVKSYV